LIRIETTEKQALPPKEKDKNIPIWEEGLTEEMKERGKRQYQERKEKEEEMTARKA
jgi:hypothetical protein